MIELAGGAAVPIGPRPSLSPPTPGPDRVGDAHQRLRGSPLAQVANRLEKEVVVSSIFGTNSIEGGTLSEEETQLALDLDPAQVQDVEQRMLIGSTENSH